MTKSPSDFWEDEWFVLYKDADWGTWEAEGPYSSRISAERGADDLSHYNQVRVVHSVFTY